MHVPRIAPVHLGETLKHVSSGVTVDRTKMRRFSPSWMLKLQEIYVRNFQWLTYFISRDPNLPVHDSGSLGSRSQMCGCDARTSADNLSTKRATEFSAPFER
jgi:hypothetical protein